MQFDALEESVIRLQITSFQNCNNKHQYTKTTDNENFIFRINACSPIKKQSNQN